MRFIKYVCRGAPLSTSPYHISKGSLAKTETSSHDAFPYYLLQREVASILVYSSFTGTTTTIYGNNGVTRRWRYGEKMSCSTTHTLLSLAVRHCATVAKQPGEENGIGGEMAEAEALLRERFGPQAKLVLRRSPKRRLRRNSAVAVTQPIQEGGDGEEEEDVVVEEEEPVASAVGSTADDSNSRNPELLQDYMEYRASATCRLLGFPVELAAASGQEAQEVLAHVLNEALGSDVIFILPQQRISASSQKGRGRSRGRGQQRRGGGGVGGYQQYSNTPTLSPRQMEFKAILDELRELCVHFSRVLKFSIKSPQTTHQKQEEEEQEEQQKDKGERNTRQREWRCRAYVRDEWGVAPSLVFTGEARGQSANDSLMRCFAMLRDRYRAELESAFVQLESVREVEAFVQPWGKTVESHCFEENNTDEGESTTNGNRKSGQKKKKKTDSSLDSDVMETEETGSSPTVSLEEQYRALRPTTYTAAVIVEDAQGNVFVSQVKRQSTPLSAYQNASSQALRSEASLSSDITILDQSLPPSPLLVRMRWQFDAMVQYLAQEQGKRPEEFAEIRIEGDGSSNSSSNNNNNNNNIKGMQVEDGITQNGSDVETNSKHSVFFSACFISDGCIVWQQSGSGRYRLEFDCYVQALTYLLDQYPDEGRALFDSRGGGVLFPTTQLLELAVLKHDNYNVATNHRGKWNVYALLGTLTSQLIGSFYQTVYNEDRSIGEARAILTVNDGLRSNQLLIQRQAKKRGEAWRNACLDALRENFPNQYRDALLLHPDIDLSGDTMARGSKYRALPREKRVEHIGNIFSLVAAFAEEDLGWYNLRVRLRNASRDLGLPQWVAEMEAQIEGEEHRRVVAISPPYSQVKHARRVLVYQVAKKYFPKELETYAKLNRGDAGNPDQDARNLDNTVYRAGTESFLNQVISLLDEQAPGMSPFSWTLEEHMDSDTQESSNDGSVECLLRPFNPRFRAVVYGQNGDLLIAERVGDEDESAVCVLCSVLRAATNRLAGDKGEQLWTEYECHAPPPVSSPRELSLYLFNAFFGISTLGLEEEGEAGVGALEPSVVDLDARALGGFWFATLSLPRAGGLPVARAVASSRREAVRDVLLLACRRAFPRPLRYLAAHSREAGPVATAIVDAPVVDNLPPPAQRDLRRTIERAELAGPPRPYTLLTRAVTRDYRGERWLRVEQLPGSGGGFQCRIYLQHHRREAKKGEVQLIGFGAALSRSQALHIASICALENLFEDDLAEAIARSPNYKDLPPLE